MFYSTPDSVHFKTASKEDLECSRMIFVVMYIPIAPN
jgi:hypothetical protein